MATQQYVYVLKLRPDLLDEKNWTTHEEHLVDVHFQRLQSDSANGKVILAGRTINSDPTQFGVVIFEAASDDGARDYMITDPAVAAGVMCAELFPFRVALPCKNPS